MGRKQIEIVMYAFGISIYLHRPNIRFHRRLAQIEADLVSVDNPIFTRDSVEFIYDIKECFNQGVKYSALDKAFKK